MQLASLSNEMTKRGALGFGVNIEDILRGLIQLKLVEYNSKNDTVKIHPEQIGAQKTIIKLLKESPSSFMEVTQLFFEVSKLHNIGFFGIRTLHPFLRLTGLMESKNIVVLAYDKKEGEYRLKLA